MKSFRIIFATMAILLLVPAVSEAGDFDWVRDFNLQAQGDPTGFRARMAGRFQIGDARIDAIIGNATKPADAYIIFRLGEMSRQPPEYVMKRYKTGKKQGWGALAKSLGIKPGSAEFHALKRGQDLYGPGGAQAPGPGERGGKSKGGKGGGKGKNWD